MKKYTPLISIIIFFSISLLCYSEGQTMREIENMGIFDFKSVKIKDFISPEVCADCHTQIFDQWKGSMHSKAFTDPIWRAATKLFMVDATTEGQQLEMKACVKCHVPLGFRATVITSPAGDYDKLQDISAQGIFCNWCHNINEVKHLGDAGYEVEPGDGEENPSTMLGPFKDSKSSYHPSKYSELHTKSDFCGICHNVSHVSTKVPIESTYEEWKKSVYNTLDPSTTVTCQDCHMRQRPGIPATGSTERPDNPGKACDTGPERKHIWTHYFVGGNAVVTSLQNNQVHADMAVERLQNAASLELIKNSSYSKNSSAMVQVKVTNSGAGHYLPTGLSELREMWLDVKITDSSGNEILRSGAIDDRGEIDKKAVRYYTQLGNKKGEPVINVALADRILSDNRIPPKSSVIESYSFNIPADAVSPFTVDIRLRYRSLSQGIATALMGVYAPKIPVIDMAEVKGKLEF